MYRFNPDIIENFFSCTRSMGCTNDHPTPLEFKHRLKWYVMEQHSDAVFTQNRNVDHISEDLFVQLSDTQECLTKNIITKYNVPEDNEGDEM